MAFSNSFNGDYVALNHIVQTLDAKSYLIPGVTVNPNLSATAGGEVAYFYTRSASNVGTGTVGAQLTYASEGAKRIDVSLTSALTIATVLPHVNFATVTPDLVGDKVIQETMKRTNEWNRLGSVAIEAGAEAKTVSTGSFAKYYDKIVEAIAQFKIDNADNALSPTAVYVSPSVYGALLTDERFARVQPIATDFLIEADIRKIAGVYVIENVDLATYEFVVLHNEGVAAPININSLVVADGTPAGYPAGTIIAGELGYGFKVVTKTDDASLDQVSGYLVAGYTSVA